MDKIIKEFSHSSKEGKIKARVEVPFSSFTKDNETRIYRILNSILSTAIADQKNIITANISRVNDYAPLISLKWEEGCFKIGGKCLNLIERNREKITGNYAFRHPNPLAVEHPDTEEGLLSLSKEEECKFNCRQMNFHITEIETRLQAAN